MQRGSYVTNHLNLHGGLLYTKEMIVMSYEIVLPALFVCGHYFVQHGSVQVCTFYLFFWKTSFSSSCAFCVFEFDVIFINFDNICIILYIVYIVSVWYSVFLFSLEQISRHKIQLLLFIKNMSPRSFLVLNIQSIKKN